jgi:hypothetical protein
MKFNYCREFGFLPHPISAEFDGCRITPLATHSETLTELEKFSNIDGYLYPPTICKYELDLATLEPRRKIDRTERPASVFDLPSSHTIEINKSDPNANDEALLINLLAFAYGTRLQFKEWRIDGRVPLKSTSPYNIADSTAIHFVGHAYEWWRRQNSDIQINLINVLYVLARARTLEWDWDAFIHQYLIFDSIYKLHTKLHPKSQYAKNPKHKDRFKFLTDNYGIATNQEIVNKIHEARNDLFHEAMWVGSTIGFGSQNNDARQYPYHLNRLNSKLLCHILCYGNEYSRLGWWFMGASVFDKCREG